jgi:hypothetical protein
METLGILQDLSVSAKHFRGVNAALRGKVRRESWPVRSETHSGLEASFGTRHKDLWNIPVSLGKKTLCTDAGIGRVGW